DRAEHRRDEGVRLSFVATLDARDHVHRDLVDVLREMDDRLADAQHLALTRTSAALKVRQRDLPPDLAERGALLGVGDDHEVPVLRVACGRRLLGELEAFLQQDRKSTRLNSSHVAISYAVFCLKKKKETLSDINTYWTRKRVMM